MKTDNNEINKEKRGQWLRRALQQLVYTLSSLVG